MGGAESRARGATGCRGAHRSGVRACVGLGLREGGLLLAAQHREQVLLFLRVVQGFSAAEVGQIVGATPEVITKRLSRAKQRLRAAYLALNSQRKEQNLP